VGPVKKRAPRDNLRAPKKDACVADCWKKI
jgi:hypothetical protein